METHKIGPTRTESASRRRPLPREGPALAAALLFLLAAGSCSGPPGGARAGAGMPPVPVEIATATKQTWRDGFQALGTIEADKNVEIVSEISGTVRELPFQEGQPVSQGAVLATIDGREERAEADRAAALVEQVRLAHRRTERLHEQKLVSAEERERAEAELKVAEANFALARARADKTRLRAPFAGFVGPRRVSPGAYVRPGDVITDLAQLDLLRVRFTAPERFASALRTGARVTLTTTAYPGQAFSGTIDVVDPQIDPGTRTFDLIARIANPGRRLKPGMSASVTATISERPDVVVVPDEAVVSQGTETFVYLVRPDSTVQQAVVALGLRDSARVEVRAGLAGGERIVRAGHQKLFPGAKVAPVAEGRAAPPGGDRPAPGAAADSGR